jgi:Tol biopolymer transport system component
MRTFLFAVASLVAASILSSCKQDPASTVGTPLPLSSNTPAANPAVAYIGSATATVKKVIYTYCTIAVMDSTDANQTNLVTAAFNTTEGAFAYPSWDYDGTSIAYGSYETSAWAINAVDVSVNSKGVPVGSNVRTIYSLTSSDSVLLQAGPAWCASSSTNKIAFTRLHFNKSDYGITDLCTISQLGGTPTVLASYKKLLGTVCLGLYESPTWSPDDSKIAVARQDTDDHFTIVIFNSSTGAAEDSIPISGACHDLQWSRSGLNELLYVYTPNSETAWELSYVAPSTGSSPTTNSVTGYNPTWSPNNSGVMYYSYSSNGLAKLQSFTSNSTSLEVDFPGGTLDWKR